MKHWRKMGLLVFSYMDNFCVLAKTKELLQIRDTIIAPWLEKLGWVQEVTKGCWDLVQRAEVLGLIVDLQEGHFFMPDNKMAKVKCMCNKVKASWSMTKQKIAAVVGFLLAHKRAVPLVQVYLWSAYCLMGNGKRDWEKKITIIAKVASNIAEIGRNLELWQGALIWRLLQVLVMKMDIVGEESRGWGAYLLGLGEMARAAQSKEEKDWDIWVKKLNAVLIGICLFKEILWG